MALSGNDLIEMGYEPGKHFAEMLEVANSLVEQDLGKEVIKESLDEIYEKYLSEKLKIIPLQDPIPYSIYLDDGNNEYEKSNVEAVKGHMDELVKTPTIRVGAIMPDACPAGSAPGTIPVGGVVATENAIHPGFHSADICCSMFLTSFEEDVPVSEVLDAVQKCSHFGYGGRTDNDSFKTTIDDVCSDNKFLDNPQIKQSMQEHFRTQGDGNHFFYVGKKKSNGHLTFVTHHGSRKPGALLYKAGMKKAKEYCSKYAPDVAPHNAWLPYDTEDGQAYWEALQVIRNWTQANHLYIHKSVATEVGLETYSDMFWNEHNFVFKDNDLFWHAKGSTPVWGGHASDADKEGRTIIPLNMSEPILIVKNHSENTLGFAPHGAGRNMSRTQFTKLNAGKTVEQIMEEQTKGIDVRFYSGAPDMSELPGAYKNANEVKSQIEKYKLAEVVDEILPLGTMMAGELPKPWLKKEQ